MTHPQAETTLLFYGPSYRSSASKRAQVQIIQTHLTVLDRKLCSLTPDSDPGLDLTSFASINWDLLSMNREKKKTVPDKGPK